MLRCQPARAWAVMKTGHSLNEVAAMTGDDPGALDAAIWDWRAEQAGARRVVPGIPADQALDFHVAQMGAR